MPSTILTVSSMTFRMSATLSISTLPRFLALVRSRGGPWIGATRAIIDPPMTAYGFLVLPSLNRVYGRAAVDLVQAELAVCNEGLLSGRCHDISTTTIGG